MSQATLWTQNIVVDDTGIDRKIWTPNDIAPDSLRRCIAAAMIHRAQLGH